MTVKVTGLKVTTLTKPQLAPLMEAIAELNGFAFKNKEEAISLNCCLKCGLDVTDRNLTDACRREYLISGIDGICYDAIFSEDEKC